MPDWLQNYWGAVVALCAFVGTLIVIAQHLKGEIEQHAPLRAWIARWLVMPSWHDAYRDWLGRRLHGLQIWMGGLWSGKALARCLAIAFAYPVALMLFGYAFGGPGTVGATEFLPTFGDWRQPVLGLGLLVVLGGMGLIIAFSERLDERLQAAIAARLARRGVADPERGARWRYRLGGALAAASPFLAVGIYRGSEAFAFVGPPGAEPITPWLAFVVAVAVAVAQVGAVAGAVARAVAFAVALVVAAVVGGGFAVAVAFAGAVAFALALAVPVAVAFAVAAVGAAVGAFGGGRAENAAFVTLLLFLAVLPAANALLDWPSWAISRWLGQELYDLMQGDRVRRLERWMRWLFKGLWQPVSFVVHVVVDLGAAFLLLIGLAALLPFLIQLYNDALVAAGGAAPLALKEFLDNAVAQPWPSGFWALAMLATTLLPTAAHAGVVIATLFVWLMQPTEWRQDIVAGLQAGGRTAKAKKDLAWAATRASWLVILTPLVAGALVILLGYGITRLIGLWEPVAQLLLGAAHFGIARADDLARWLGWLPAP